MTVAFEILQLFISLVTSGCLIHRDPYSPYDLTLPGMPANQWPREIAAV